MYPTIDEQIERLVLRRMFPNASPGRIKRLHELSKKKGVHIIHIPKQISAVDCLMISIVRHESTQYESVLHSGMCSRDTARGIIAPIIKNEMIRMKGE